MQIPFSPNNPPPELGAILRKARKTGGLTLEQVSERSGVSKSMLSQIERGIVNPTFAVVWNLMQSLGLDMGDLDGVSTGSDPVLIEHLHGYSTPTRTSADGLVSLRMLGPYRSNLPMEWYDMSIAPGGKLSSDAHAVGTIEHLTCLHGKVEVILQEHRFNAVKGDTLRYRADRPHIIHNDGSEATHALLMVALPKSP